MSILIQEDDVFELTVHFGLDEKSIVKVLDAPEEGCETVTFTFRKPSWKDVRKIVETSYVSNGDGTSFLDPIAYIESKVKVLLKAWTLLDQDKKPIPISKVDKVPARVMIYVGTKMDDFIGDLLGVMKEQQPPEKQG